jgi:hypothetical protein
MTSHTAFALVHYMVIDIGEDDNVGAKVFLV